MVTILHRCFLTVMRLPWRKLVTLLEHCGFTFTNSQHFNFFGVLVNVHTHKFLQTGCKWKITSGSSDQILGNIDPHRPSNGPILYAAMVDCIYLERLFLIVVACAVAQGPFTLGYHLWVGNTGSTLATKRPFKLAHVVSPLYIFSYDLCSVILQQT